jgi:hypothetical protein
MSRRVALTPALTRMRERECMASVMRMTWGAHTAIPSPRAAGRGQG